MYASCMKVLLRFILVFPFKDCQSPNVAHPHETRAGRQTKACVEEASSRERVLKIRQPGRFDGLDSSTRAVSTPKSGFTAGSCAKLIFSLTDVL